MCLLYMYTYVEFTDNGHSIGSTDVSGGCVCYPVLPEELSKYLIRSYEVYGGSPRLFYRNILVSFITLSLPRYLVLYLSILVLFTSVIGFRF